MAFRVHSTSDAEAQRHIAAALPDGMEIAAERLERLGNTNSSVLAPHRALKVCILTADFWGLKSAGGTATAFHLLAAALSADPNIQVIAADTCLLLDPFISITPDA